MTVWSTSDEPLPPGTESRLLHFTELMATAIANAESREALAELADEQAALRRVATLVAQGVRAEEIFSAVSEEVGRLFGTDLAAVGRFEDDPPSNVVVGLATSIEGVPIESRLEFDDSMSAAEVYRTGRSRRASFARQGSVVAFVFTSRGPSSQGQPTRDGLEIVVSGPSGPISRRRDDIVAMIRSIRTAS